MLVLLHANLVMQIMLVQYTAVASLLHQWVVSLDRCKIYQVSCLHLPNVLACQLAEGLDYQCATNEALSLCVHLLFFVFHTSLPKSSWIGKMFFELVLE